MSVIGTRMLRKEDPALLVGEGKYIDDIQVEGQLWMGMVRSTVAHAKIAAVDLSAALEQPGVVGAYTGADLADGYWIAPMPCACAGRGGRGRPGTRRHGRRAAAPDCRG